MKAAKDPLLQTERRLGLIMLLPAFLLLAFVVIYPLAQSLYSSFHFSILTQPWRGKPFVGLDNYIAALNDSRFWESVMNTMFYIFITVPGAVIVGLGLALLANRIITQKWIVRLALLLPWALPLVFAGLIFRWFFEYQQGIVNNVLKAMGFLPQAWLTTPSLAFFAICLAIIWKSSSFVALVLLAGLQTIPKTLYEAAEIDGATPFQQFWRITLPLLKPAIFVALIFRTITAIQTFDIPHAMTNGGPGYATESFAMLIHKTTVDMLDLGLGSALAVLMFIFSALITAYYLKHTLKDPNHGGE